MKVNAIIAIDPGHSNGGIVIKTDTINTYKMPKDMKDLRDILQPYKDNYNPIAFVEKLSIRTDDIDMGAGDKKAAMSKLFRIQTMMANFEHLKAILETMDIPFILVHPMKWQSGLNLRIKGEDKAERKRRYKEIAQAHNPLIKVTLWNSDALLIKEFGEYALVNLEKWMKAQLPERERYKVF